MRLSVAQLAKSTLDLATAAVYTTILLSTEEALMNLTIKIGDNRAYATVRTTLHNLKTRNLLDESDKNIVLGLLENLLPKCDTIMTRVRGLEYVVEVK